MNMGNTTPVVFRVWPDGGVLALFPTLPGSRYGCFCDSYEHIGQHGAADYHGCIRATRPAKREEFELLESELQQRGYLLRVVKRATAAMHSKRKSKG